MYTDTLIIGCGIAGATAALRLSENPNHQVTIITRAPDPEDNNTAWAQGGIVSAGIGDSPDLLVNDILSAGAGLSSKKAAQILATEGPRLVQSILVDRCGVQFDRDENSQLIYGLEAAHSVRRIVHVADKTGAAIAKHLILTLQERSNIRLLTSHTAIDLIRDEDACIGASVLDDASGTIEVIYAANTLLATGGLGQVYQHTTNPHGARGDGIAMAQRIGAKLSNLEYIQFHPTAMATDVLTKPLVSEAVRGEGARLLNPDGEYFMSKYAPQDKELAPRDVVARAIHSEMSQGNYDYVLLDIANQRDADFIRERFPTLVENAALMGLDATREPIPVVPAAHYSCGGVSVDEWGRTSVNRLFAIGEVSCTGLHGANRLASTSLLEGLVWGDRSARYINLVPHERPQATKPLTEVNHKTVPENLEFYWRTVRKIMWDKVGIVRTHAQLHDAEKQLAHVADKVATIAKDSRLTDELIGLRNAVQTAQAITFAARQNPYSLGAHFRDDSMELVRSSTS